MDMPDSIAAIADQLAAGGPVVAAPELFAGREVFLAELGRLLLRPWMAADHVSRLRQDGEWFRCDAANRSIVIVRENARSIHALRNICLHAGYRICEEEDGRAERLLCRYHGWEYALDGLLTEPLLRPQQTDRSRFRLPRYALRICRGLIFIDPSAAAPPSEPLLPEPALDPSGIAAELEAFEVTRRQRYATNWNWKHVRQFLLSSPGLFDPGAGAGMGFVELGPLSLLLAGPDRAVLLRIIPKFPGHTDFDMIRMAAPGAAADENGPDRVAEALRRAGDIIAAAPETALDRDFFSWYWPLISASATDAAS